MIKRLFDISFSMIGLIFLFPVFLITATLVFINFGSPIFFKQVRPGYQGQPFTIFKFRTMANFLDHTGNLLPDHLRLTKFGHALRSTSLDELPALLNVLLGNLKR